VSALILLQQHQWLECPVDTVAFIHRKALVLPDRQQPSILAESDALDRSFEVKLPHHEIPVQIKQNRVSSIVDDDEQGLIG
jgi:hypothetical protein